MNLIGFSHHYTKMHGQIHGKLIYADYFFVSYKDAGAEWLKYDTEYKDWDGTPQYENILKTMELYSRLVFIGDKNIPFTTYRVMYDYKDFVGEEFVFKFKGERIPPFLMPIGRKFGIKIFE